MNFPHSVRTALHALRRNVLRAVLTILGIVIGIAAVIAMMEIGRGSATAIQKTIASMGANTLMVLPGTAASGGVSFGAGSVLTLTPEDGDAIAKECPAVKAAAPVVRARAQAVFGNHNWVPMSISGTTPDFLAVRDWEVTQGEAFTDRDVRNSTKTCVVGQTIARELFQGEDPVGRDIRLQNVSFKVTGVLARKGANMMGADQDDIILAPWTAIKYRIGGTSSSSSTSQSGSSSSSSNAASAQFYANTQVDLYPKPSATASATTPGTPRFENVDQIIVAAYSAEEVDSASDEIIRLLRERHRIKPGEPDDFNIRNMAEMTRAMTSTSTLMTNLLLTVALISLIVGGVGIMNIMLVSVTERTHEIGLRMAVGARPKDILRQFLVESIVLCILGGVLGILLGRGISLLVALFLHWPTETALEAIVAAVAVSMSVGVIFGYYPAWKASRMDPIEALRYE